MSVNLKLQTGSSIYQKQMSRLMTLPADLHQGALLHKDLNRKTQDQTEHFTSHPTMTQRPSAVINVVLNQAGDSQLNDCSKGSTGWCRADRVGWQRNNALIGVMESYPARLQQVPLASNTVLYVDQTQQVLLTHKDR